MGDGGPFGLSRAVEGLGVGLGLDGGGVQDREGICFRIAGQEIQCFLPLVVPPPTNSLMTEPHLFRLLLLLLAVELDRPLRRWS